MKTTKKKLFRNFSCADLALSGNILYLYSHPKPPSAGLSTQLRLGYVLPDAPTPYLSLGEAISTS